MGFLMFPVGEEWFSRSMRIPSGIFWRCKFDEILTINFFLRLVLRMMFLILFYSKVRNFLRKCLLSTASPVLTTSRERHKSVPYLRLKNSQRTSKSQVFSFTVPEKPKSWTKLAR